ncbi:hypothetical protein cyc_00136 [Cyclospora cayetanensis]|uniref:Uncharacterized protein n=1 Tax=Cyclospora cayetanensis TaxID=88456 RepID=A0A1D3D9Y2_9EIME|nr:hypothetical protein cyc_00136 [Cyclospora cayetanensis]
MLLRSLLSVSAAVSACFGEYYEFLALAAAFFLQQSRKQCTVTANDFPSTASAVTPAELAAPVGGRLAPCRFSCLRDFFLLVPRMLPRIFGGISGAFCGIPIPSSLRQEQQGSVEEAASSSEPGGSTADSPNTAQQGSTNTATQQQPPQEQPTRQQTQKRKSGGGANRELLRLLSGYGNSFDELCLAFSGDRSKRQRIHQAELEDCERHQEKTPQKNPRGAKKEQLDASKESPDCLRDEAAVVAFTACSHGELLCCDFCPLVMHAGCLYSCKPIRRYIPENRRVAAAATFYGQGSGLSAAITAEVQQLPPVPPPVVRRHAHTEAVKQSQSCTDLPGDVARELLQSMGKVASLHAVFFLRDFILQLGESSNDDDQQHFLEYGPEVAYLLANLLGYMGPSRVLQQPTLRAAASILNVWSRRRSRLTSDGLLHDSKVFALLEASWAQL